jgi:hypothetical protein
MWRRETRLAYWLSRDSKQGASELAGGFKEKILSIMQPAGFSCDIHAESLTILSAAITLNAVLVARAEVHDGLSQINPAPDFSQSDNDRSLTNVFKCGINSMGLLHSKNIIRDFSLMSGNRAKVYSGILQVTPRLHNISLHERGKNPRTVECLPEGLSPIKHGNRWIIKETLVKSNLSQLGALYFKRRSLDIDKLDDSECQGFLMEAEALRHVPTGRSELLAVFRSVPIEIISQLRYFSDKRMILYSISNQLQRTQTRLHDLAAIRDVADQEIHLVPHRAQYKTVSLAG